MLVDVFDAFLRELKNERELDGPLNSLLWSMGLRNVSFVHGPFEFGKDFVAQADSGNGCLQYYIQSKGGDISLTDWKKDILAQCETMVRTKNGPPGFDPALPRQLVLAFNGEFQGQAGILAKEFAADLLEHRGWVIEFWNRKRLSEMLADHYSSAYRGVVQDAQGYFANLGAVFTYAEECSRGDFSWSRLEEVTRRWLSPGSERGIHVALVEAYWLRQLLNQRGLRLHATLVTHGLARLVGAMGPDFSSLLRLVAEVYKNLLIQDAAEFFTWFDSIPETHMPKALIGDEPALMFSTGVRVAYLTELCALYVLLAPDDTNLESASRFIQVSLSLGCLRRPISEDFAVSVPIVCIACKKLNIEFLPWIQGLAVWAFDSVIPSPRRSAEDHISSLDPRTNASKERRPKISFLLAALLDTASLLGERQLYSDLVNDAQAVDLIPAVLVPVVDSGREQFLIGGDGVNQAYGGNYRESWTGDDGWKNAGHHHFADKPTSVDLEGMSWLTLGTSLLLRDRWWLHSLRRELLKVEPTVSASSC